MAAAKPKRLALPRPVQVRSGPGGRPRTVEGRAVEAVLETWLVEDRWWTDRPLRRRSWELLLDGGRSTVVFRDLVDGRWYRVR